MNKKLYKSREGKKVCGVCVGLSEYFGIDVTVIRLIWAITVCIYGAGLVVYFICALVFPEKGNVIKEDIEINDKSKTEDR